MNHVTKKIYYILLFALLASCQYEQKPLQVLPFTAHRVLQQEDSTWKGKVVTVPGMFYIRNFRDNKEGLKELLYHIKDSLAEPQLLDRSKVAYLYKKNKGLYFEGDEAYVDQKSFYVRFYPEDYIHFEYFRTWSKIWLNNSDFKEKGDRNFEVHTEGDTAKVTFPYKEFNTDVWQKFLNITFYERYRIQREEDYPRHNLRVDRKKRFQFTDWSAPTTYILVHPQSGEQECIIHYPFNRKYAVFRMDIP